MGGENNGRWGSERTHPTKIAAYAIMHFCTPNGDLVMGRWQELEKGSNTYNSIGYRPIFSTCQHPPSQSRKIVIYFMSGLLGSV
jgi:hypothetical protein